MYRKYTKQDFAKTFSQIGTNALGYKTFKPTDSYRDIFTFMRDRDFPMTHIEALCIVKTCLGRWPTQNEINVIRPDNDQVTSQYRAEEYNDYRLLYTWLNFWQSNRIYWFKAGTQTALVLSITKDFSPEHSKGNKNMFTVKYSHNQGLKMIQSGRGGRKKLANNTYMSLNPYTGFIDIKLHGNCIIQIRPDNSFIVSHCGWQTKTTKDRINEYTNLGLYQRKHVWYTKDDLEFQSNTSYGNVPEQVIELMSQFESVVES
jgi:hypothetical protein